MSAKQIFEKFDSNKRGELSMDEFHEGVLAFNQNIGKEDIVKMFVEIDVDGDGKLGVDEFTSFFDTMLKEGFDLCDGDGDGLITSNEVHGAMVGLGKEITEERCDEMVRAINANGDGFLCFEEFVTLIINMLVK